MLKRNLNLVAFALPDECKLLADNLRQLGYDLTVSPGHNWLVNPSRPIPPDVIVLFLGDTPYPGRQVQSVLEDMPVPVLAIFQGPCVYDDKELLGSCRDFLRWPCAEQELEFRLERLCPSPKGSAAGVKELVLIEEFAHFNMAGNSPAFLQALSLIKKIARCDAPVLIEGETGTGKELAARAIHYIGARRDYPFIAINCGTIPESLIENEWFGHEKGAFTDAKEAQPGLVAQAERGTLFLDEVDTLSAKAQVVLLRFLQDQQYRPLGGKCAVSADVRIVAASNTDLQKQVEAGRFRQDLFFRLKIMTVTLPPLRSRPGDITLLAELFLCRYNAQYRGSPKILHPASLTWLNRQLWPGNVRELENLIHREFLLTDVPMIALGDGPQGADRRRGRFDRRKKITFDAGFLQAKTRTIAEFEKSFLSWALAQAQGNVSLAAKQAGKERRAFGKLLKKYDIDAGQYRTTSPLIPR